MNPDATFMRDASRAAGDRTQQDKIRRAVSTYAAKVQHMKSSQFVKWSDGRDAAAAIKSFALARLPELLEQFEAAITARGAEVRWAADAAEARNYVLDVVQRYHGRPVVKSKSMLTEEVDLRGALDAAGIPVWESDLGEFIVQLAGEKPYHIVTPAMHKTAADVSALFQQHLGIEPTDDPAELTAAARTFMRGKFVDAAVGITGANFILADAGAVSVTENEGNALLSMACSNVHIVLVGIEKVLPLLTDLSLFLPLLATSGSGQQLTCYNSVIFGPRQPGDVDGPDSLVVILVDNGRSTLYANDLIREALRCIRCGACLNSCPVYRTIGGHAYNTTYQGPIGSVITPHLPGGKEWAHLSSASSLCGACTASCPVGIDLHHLLVVNRSIAVSRKNADGRVAQLMNIWAYFFSSRRRLQWGRTIWLSLERLVSGVVFRKGRYRPPRPARKAFSEWWQENDIS